MCVCVCVYFNGLVFWCHHMASQQRSAVGVVLYGPNLGGPVTLLRLYERRRRYWPGLHLMWVWKRAETPSRFVLPRSRQRCMFHILRPP